jgi:hypothetical protein
MTKRYLKYLLNVPCLACNKNRKKRHTKGRKEKGEKKRKKKKKKTLMLCVKECFAIRNILRDKNIWGHFANKKYTGTLCQ